MTKIFDLILEVINLGLLVLGLDHSVILFNNPPALFLHFIDFSPDDRQEPFFVSLHPLPDDIIHFIYYPVYFVVIFHELVVVLLRFLHYFVFQPCLRLSLMGGLLVHIYHFNPSWQGQRQVVRFYSSPDSGRVLFGDGRLPLSHYFMWWIKYTNVYFIINSP